MSKTFKILWGDLSTVYMAGKIQIGGQEFGTLNPITDDGGTINNKLFHFHQGDRILAINGRFFDSGDAMSKYLWSLKPGDTADISYVPAAQNGVVVTVTVPIVYFCPLYTTKLADLQGEPNNGGFLGITVSEGELDLRAGQKIGVLTVTASPANPEFHPGDMIYIIDYAFYDSSAAMIKWIQSKPIGSLVQVSFVSAATGLPVTEMVKSGGPNAQPLVAAASQNPPPTVVPPASDGFSVGTVLAVGLLAAFLIHLDSVTPDQDPSPGWHKIGGCGEATDDWGNCETWEQHDEDSSNQDDSNPISG